MGWSVVVRDGTRRRSNRQGFQIIYSAKHRSTQLQTQVGEIFPDARRYGCPPTFS
jgi:hypothetical protein